MLRLAILLIAAAIDVHAQAVASAPKAPKYSTVVRADVAAPLDSVKRRVIRVFAARSADMDTVTVDGAFRVHTDEFFVKGAGMLQIVAYVRPDTAGAVVELRGTRRFIGR